MLQKTKTTTSTHLDITFLYSTELVFVYYIKISNKERKKKTNQKL